MVFRTALISLIVTGLTGLALPAAGQTWQLVDTEGNGGAGASVCAAPTAEGDRPPCLRLTCEADTPLHYEIALFGDLAPGRLDEIAVELRVDGRAAGLLLFDHASDTDGTTALTAPFDPRLHGGLIERLRRGNRAELVIQSPNGAITALLPLRGSSRTLGAVMDTCPMPEVPLNDPAAVVLDQIVRQCGELGGSVAMEPGFERREDLDGDGQDDVVIDYAAAVCSEMASLYCGSGGCTVGFFLAREEGYERIFDGVIRGYVSKPGGLLALDLHGTACGLYGFEACRKVFRISDDSFTLVEEMSGNAAEAAQLADRFPADKEPDADPAEPADDGHAATTVPLEEPANTDAPPGADPDAAALVATGKSIRIKTDGQPPAADAPAPAPANPPESIDSGLEWMGDGGSVFIPAEGESLPDDLDPGQTAPTGPDTE